MNNHCDCIDYPVSWDFWRAHCLEQHGFDPGSNEPIEPPKESLEPPGTTRQCDIINQLRGEVTHIHTDLHQKKAKRIPSPNRYNKYL
ncbi:hypothetical protein LCGC14_0420430 [marine sediment metagenome]|uniref:Uncharacterized protein n=1 Tax=marine sediment metagenome TaxID=412755 RepID=A0A0F9SX40_9ZZZZ